MKFTIKREELHALATKAAAVADGKSMVSLGNAALRAADGRLHVAATDLYASVRSSAACTVDEAGSVAVPAKALKDVVGKLPEGEVRIMLDGAKLRLTSGRSRYHLPTMSADDLPPIPEAPEGGVEVDGAELGRLLESTSFAMSTDSSRAHIACVLLDVDAKVMRAVSTDGHRLQLVESHRNGEAMSDAASIPPKGVQLLRGLRKAPVVIARKGSVLFAIQDGTVFGVKLLDDAYPPYDKVVPKRADRKIRIDREAVVDALGRIRLVTGAVDGATMKTTDAVLTIEAEDPDAGGGVEELPIAGTEGPAVGFNVKYLLEALSRCHDDEVELWLTGALDPIQVRGERYVSVIMPMRT